MTNLPKFSTARILPKFSTALLHPRYWLTWLGIGVLCWVLAYFGWSCNCPTRLVVQLPYPVIYRLGCGLGKLALRFMKTGVTFYETTRKNCASQPGTVCIATWNCASRK